MFDQPVFIRDDDIKIVLPSSEGLPDAVANDFRQVDSATASCAADAEEARQLDKKSTTELSL